MSEVSWSPDAALAAIPLCPGLAGRALVRHAKRRTAVTRGTRAAGRMKVDARPYGLSVKALVVDSQGRCLLPKGLAGSRFYAGQWKLAGALEYPAARVLSVARASGGREATNRLAGAGP